MEVPQYGVQEQSPGWGRISPEADAFVNECQNFVVLGEKISKTAKNAIIKN